MSPRYAVVRIEVEVDAGFRHRPRLGHAASVGMLEGSDARNLDRRRLVRRPAREVKPTK